MSAGEQNYTLLSGIDLPVDDLIPLFPPIKGGGNRAIEGEYPQGDTGRHREIGRHRVFMNETANIAQPKDSQKQGDSTGMSLPGKLPKNLRPGEIKFADGLEGYLMELELLEEAIFCLEQDLQDREARRRTQEPGSFARKLNEKFMKAALSEYERKKAKINYLLGVVSEIVGEKKTTPGRGVTDAEIERARQYPIENLIESKRGMARCVSGTHEDRNASMQTTGNFAYCHACGFKADVIGLYQKLHGASFVDAVRALQ